MGKYDYQKSYERQMESIVMIVCAIYTFTELYVGTVNHWNPWGQVVVLAGLLVSWIFFFGKYYSFEARAFIVSITSQIMMFVYAVEVQDFYSIISVYISLCIVMGLYGIPKVMPVALVSYTCMVLYYIFGAPEEVRLIFGTYNTDWGMITRICQPYVVIFVVFFLVYRYKVSQESMLEAPHVASQ